MDLPRFLGNRLTIGSKDLPESLRRYWPYSDLEVYGQSFSQEVVLPAGFIQHEAFRLEVGDQGIVPIQASFVTDQPISIQLNIGGTIQCRHELLPGLTTIEFAQALVHPYVWFFFDIENHSPDAEAYVRCQLLCHIYCRAGGLLWGDAFRAAHIETAEERAAREAREREAHRRRVEAEVKAWQELEHFLGREVAEVLKQNKVVWCRFLGSNGDTYAISNRGELANVTKGRRYCVVLVGVPSGLPIPDIIMEKIKWCQLKADEVEEKANSIGEFSEATLEMPVLVIHSA